MAMDFIQLFRGTFHNHEIVEPVVEPLFALWDFVGLIRFSWIDPVGRNPVLVPFDPFPLLSGDLVDADLQDHGDDLATIP